MDLTELLMKTQTLTQRRKALARTRRNVRQAWNSYVVTRYAYCAGKATIQELAHALAVVGVANAKLVIAR